mmetsp:Transcript_22571/g.44657  ORF Transcript_22571/g.44657 Transcript_22571/m.44657 type:complete len:261 (+) Transcript_22571:79-861(+)
MKIREVMVRKTGKVASECAFSQIKPTSPAVFAIYRLSAPSPIGSIGVPKMDEEAHRRPVGLEDGLVPGRHHGRPFGLHRAQRLRHLKAPQLVVGGEATTRATLAAAVLAAAAAARIAALRGTITTIAFTTFRALVFLTPLAVKHPLSTLAAASNSSVAAAVAAVATDTISRVSTIAVSFYFFVRIAIVVATTPFCVLHHRRCHLGITSLSFSPRVPPTLFLLLLGRGRRGESMCSSRDHLIISAAAAFLALAIISFFARP